MLKRTRHVIHENEGKPKTEEESYGMSSNFTMEISLYDPDGFPIETHEIISNITDLLNKVRG